MKYYVINEYPFAVFSTLDKAKAYARNRMLLGFIKCACILHKTVDNTHKHGKLVAILLSKKGRWQHL